MQRVIQVCFGCEHGVLVTDAGIPFTFGDNRYGQLGRSACKLSENNKPFPVLDLMEHEIVQVAAGTHHCMALTASRFVWAWGRNKVGQLGCGDTHDHITPTMVTLSTGGPQLGNIVTISAGGNSSVAASLSSEVWQWGEVSRDFTHVPRDSKDPGPPPTEKQKAVPVEKKLPFCIFRREDFQRKMRKQPTSVSELGLRVLHGLKPFEKDHVRDLFKSARKWRRSIADARVELKRETSEAQNSKSSSRGDADHSMADLNDVNDAVGTMQRELKMIDREIRLLEQNLEACELQQKHLRDEIMGLAGQGVRLSAKENQISMNLYEKGGERNLEKEMAEIKALLEANHNTRTTLLEQRTQTDKEKQHVDDQLKERRRLRDEQQKRMWRIADLQRSMDSSRNSDTVIDTASELARVLEGLSKADGRGPGELPDAMAALEAEGEQLAAIERRLCELAEGRSDPDRVAKARQVVVLLQSLVDLHRQRNGLAADRWARGDLELAGLFRGAGRPAPPRKAEAAGGQEAKFWIVPAS